MNVMRSNHPETISPVWSMQKLSSMKLVPGAKKTGDCCSKEHGFGRLIVTKEKSVRGGRTDRLGVWD